MYDKANSTLIAKNRGFARAFLPLASYLSAFSLPSNRNSRIRQCIERTGQIIIIMNREDRRAQALPGQ